jgi:hypothetical protein
VHIAHQKQLDRAVLTAPQSHLPAKPETPQLA